jgi:hypothetical protein
MPSKRSTFKNELIVREDSERYARSIKPLGNGQFKLFETETGEELTATIRPVLRRGRDNVIKPGCLVLIDHDESSTKKKWFIIHVYSEDDVKKLRKSGEIVDVKEKEVSNVVFVDDSVPNAASNDQSDDEDDEDFVNGI